MGQNFQCAPEPTQSDADDVSPVDEHSVEQLEHLTLDNGGPARRGRASRGQFKEAGHAALRCGTGQPNKCVCVWSARIMQIEHACIPSCLPSVLL